MRPHPKLRKATKRLGLSLAAVFLAAWVFACISNSACHLDFGYVVGLSEGAATVGYRDVWAVMQAAGQIQMFDDVITMGSSHPLLWRPRWIWLQIVGWLSIIPLWIPAALGLAVGVPAWVLDRRARRAIAAGACPKCHYDRSGIPAAALCPECSAAPAPAIAPPPPAPL